MSHGINFNIGGLNIGAAGKAGSGRMNASATSGLPTQEAGPDTIHHELRDGDYQVIVHVIEARKLKPVDTENGTADPVVVAKLEFPSSVVPKWQNSPRKVNTLNPVWDYTMIFRERNLSAAEAKLAILSLQIKDSNWSQRDVIIGQYDFNLSAIYGRKNHEYFQQWCALCDPTGEDSDPTGYLRVNVTVLVGSDEMAAHDEEEVQAEKFGVEFGKTKFRDVLCPPTIVGRGHDSVCLEVIRGEGIQPLDVSANFMFGGVDPYVKLQFGNQTPSCSSYVPGARDPVWEQQLQVPVQWPTMIDVITVSVWDHDLIGTDDAVGAIRFSYADLPRAAPGTIGPPVLTDFLPNWRNLYGAPPEADYQSGARSALVAFAMNHGGRDGTYYRGRLLMRLWRRWDPAARLCSYDLPIDSSVTRAFKENVSGEKSDDDRQFVAKQKDQVGRFDPSKLGENLYKYITESRYTLRLAIYQATDMDLGNTGGICSCLGDGVSIECRVGSPTAGTVQGDGGAAGLGSGCKVTTERKPVQHGRAVFNQVFEDIELSFPSISSSEKHPQFPDVFLYLVRGGKHIAYIRWTAADLSERTRKQRNSEPRWYSFVEEPCLDAFGPGEIPGSLLCNVQLGKKGSLDSRGGQLVPQASAPYTMRFHLYMAKFLPAKDENGLCDPYVVVKYYGRTLKSSVKAETCNPSWFETLVCDVDVPNDIELCPPLCVLVYDRDLIRDEFIGRFFVPVTKDSFIKDRAQVPRPAWHKLTFENEGDISGEVLASVSMSTQKETPKVPDPRLVPDTYDATVEITAIGLRDMTPVPMFGTLGDKLGLGKVGIPLVNPFLEFDVGDADTREKTHPSCAPSPSNCNFLEKYTIAMKLPQDATFAPNITLRVRDVRSLAGGAVTSKPLVATGVVALDRLMPWSKAFKAQPKNPLVQKSMELMKGADPKDPVAKKKATRKGMLGLAKGAFDGMKKMADKIEDFMDDGELDEPKFTYGRTKIDNEFENTLKYACPIMSFPLFRGCEGFLSQEMSCGTFKGYVSVSRVGDDARMPELDFSELFNVRGMTVRLYLLKAYGLPPMDANGLCDSYPEIKLGDEVITDKASKVDLNLNPNYWASYSMSCQIPGASTLTISLWDEDDMSANDLIGSTTIDLENRLFNPEWVSHSLKPLERRTLRLPSSSLSQGKVEMWVDILTPAEAKKLPMIDIKPPAKENFELRVVVWEVKKIPITATPQGKSGARGKWEDQGAQKLDLYTECNFIGYESIIATTGIGAHNERFGYAMDVSELQSRLERRVKKAAELAKDKILKAKESLLMQGAPGFEKRTEVVSNCQSVGDGARATFNHRMIWPMRYNIDSLFDKQMRLQVTVRDHDDHSKDDLVGEVQLDLQPVLKNAFNHIKRNNLMHLTQPFRIAEGMLKDWKMNFDIHKEGHKQGEVVIQIEVASAEVAQIRQAGEGCGSACNPNAHPQLPDRPR